MEEKCAACGCTVPESLAFVPSAGIWLCNGKGTVSTSHIVQFLIKTNLNEIKLHESNPLHGIELKCCNCGKTNVFDLGFGQNSKGELFIACKGQCRFKVLDNPRMNFVPFISDRSFDGQILKIPKNEEMKPVSQADIQKIVNNYLKKVGLFTELNDSTRLRHVKFTYNDVKEYQGIMLPMINSEMANASFRAKTTIFSNVPCTWKSYRECQLIVTARLVNLLSYGSSVRFSDRIENLQAEESIEVATCSKVNKREKTIEIKFINPSAYYGIQFCVVAQNFMSVPFDRQKIAVESMTDPYKVNPFIQRVFLGQFGDPEQFAYENKTDKIRLCQPNGEFPPLNEHQHDAVITSLSQKFTYIQGPPGTGKTTVIAYIVNSLVRSGIKPVLVVGHSNITADFACQMMIRANLKVGRAYSLAIEDILMGNDNDENEDRYQIPGLDPRPYSTFQHAKAEFVRIYNHEPDLSNKAQRDELYKYERYYIQSLDVVCMTTCMAGSSRVDNTYSAVVVDEAGQCTDPDVLIAAAHGCERLILIGDNKQLEPIIFSQKCKIARYDFTLISRVISMKIDCPVLLTQYRMHPGISLFPNKEFYYNKLRDGVQPDDRIWDTPILPWPNPQLPLLFWNISDSMEDMSSDGKSILNQSEIFAVASILDHISSVGGISGDSIGIITPYAAQQEFLLDNLSSVCSANAGFIRDIEISSVDSFQGREKDFIIFSAVRANSSGVIGFCQNENRLNVSITRAKYGLVVIANAETFSKNKLWCDFINYFVERGCFVEGGLNDLHPSIFVPKAHIDKNNELDDDLR